MLAFLTIVDIAPREGRAPSPTTISALPNTVEREQMRWIARPRFRVALEPVDRDPATMEKPPYLPLSYPRHVRTGTVEPPPSM